MITAMNHDQKAAEMFAEQLARKICRLFEGYQHIMQHSSQDIQEFFLIILKY